MKMSGIMMLTEKKHRIMFCASENINLRAIGLLVETNINRVTLNICHKSGNNDHCAIFRQDFDNVEVNKQWTTKILYLRQPVPLSCDRIYLLVLTFYGGASVVGDEGEEFINVQTGII